MERVAVVTGGTRGIGEAISVALKDKGMKVAATYAGNDERARAFTDRTGIPAYKFDVADHQACAEGIAMFTIDASRTIISWAAASTARASQRFGSGSTAEAPCASPRASPEGRFGSVTVSPSDGWTDCFGPAWAR